MMNTFVEEKKWLSRLVPYIKLFLRWGWFIVLSIAVTVLTTMLLPDTAVPTAYQATLQVQVLLPANLATASAFSTSTTFYSNLITNPATLSLLLPKYKGFQVSDLQGLITTAPIVGTNYVNIIVTWDSPKDAAQLVKDVYDATLQEMHVKRSNIVTALTTNLTAELKQGQSDAASSAATLQTLTLENRQFSFEYLQVSSLYNEQLLLLSSINKQLQILEQPGADSSDLLRLGSTSPTITTIPPPGPTQSQRLALSPLVGLIMGLAGILLARRFSTRLPQQGKKREIVLPNIASIIPVLPGLQKDRLQVLKKVSPCLPLYQHLRYWASEHEQHLQIISVTSSKGGEGKSLIATGLATVTSRSGQRTLLVDANPQRPILHTWFQVPNASGTLDAVNNLAKGGMALPIVPTSEPNLALITIGNNSEVNRLTEALPMDGLPTFIGSLRTQADVIIFDVPSLLNDANAVNLAQLSDMVLLVVDEQKSQSAAVVEAKNLLSAISAPFAIVLNRSQAEEAE